MRALVISFALHAAVVLLLRSPARPHDPPTASVPSSITEEPMIVEVLPGGGGDGGGREITYGCGTTAIEVDAPESRERARQLDPDAWEHRAIRRSSATPSAAQAEGAGSENGEGTGSGIGHGSGSGNGIGFGNGGGVRLPDDVPDAPSPPAPEPTPAPVRVSKARPAKLIYPTRDREVEDEADLFIAKVTVDPDGDVVGARMVKTRPGRRGDQASSAIWSFRYLPALDHDGRAIASTLDQPFQIR